METTIKKKVQVLSTWDEVIDFVLMAIMQNKAEQVKTIHAEIDCEDMRNTRLLGTLYGGSEDGEKFHMPVEQADRDKLKGLILRAKGNPSRSFVTVSRQEKEAGAPKPAIKLYWSVRYSPQ